MTERDDLKIPEPELGPLPEPEVKQRLSSRAVRRGVRIFVVLAVVAAVVVIAFTMTGETWEGLRRVQPHWLVVTIGLWIMMTLADGARLSILSMAGEHRVGIVRAAEVILAGYFMAAVTPFQVGGLPLQLYSMNKWGISPGKASAMLLARGILFYSMVFGAAPFIAAYLGVSSVLVRALSIYITIVLALGAACMVLVLAFPQVLKRWELKLAAKENPGRVRRFLVRVLGELEHFINGIKLFFHGRNILYLLGAFVLTLVYGLAYFGMSASLLAGLGQLQAGAFWRVIGANNLLVSVLLYIPTPGASGVAEAGAFGLFLELGLCAKPMLGIFIVLWRTFSFLAGAVVGGLVAVKHITRN